MNYVPIPPPTRKSFKQISNNLEYLAELWGGLSTAGDICIQLAILVRLEKMGDYGLKILK